MVEPQSLVVKPGSPTILTCAVEPNDVVVQWTFNGRTLTDTTHRRGRTRHDDDDGDDDGVEVVIRRRGLSQRQTRNEHSLHIAAFDVSRHEGVYQCLATLSTGSVLSRPATLEPAGILTFLTSSHWLTVLRQLTPFVSQEIF